MEDALSHFDGVGLRVAAVSRWWRSKSWPDPTRPDYLNGVVIVDTALDANGAMAALMRLERNFGRKRGEPNAPRTLDLDLVALGPLVINGPDLILPHPRAHLRRFVMGPLAEIAPDWIHPVLGRTARDLAASAAVGRDAMPLDG